MRHRFATLTLLASALLFSGAALADDDGTAVELTYEGTTYTATHAIAYHVGGTSTVVHLSDAPVDCGDKPKVGGKEYALTFAQPIGEEGAWKVTTVKTPGVTASWGHALNPHTVTVTQRDEDGTLAATVKQGPESVRDLGALEGTIQAKGCGISPKFAELFEAPLEDAHARRLEQGEDLSITFAGEPMDVGCAWLKTWSDGEVKLEVSTNACYIRKRRKRWKCKRVSPPVDVGISWSELKDGAFTSVSARGERVHGGQFQEFEGWTFQIDEPAPAEDAAPEVVEIQVEGSATDTKGRELTVKGTLRALDCR